MASSTCPWAGAAPPSASISQRWRTGQERSRSHGGEIQLCWDRDGRRFSLHLSYDTSRPVLTGGKLAASLDVHVDGLR